MDPAARLADVAEHQWGLVTKEQAMSSGIAWSTLSRLARHGVVERVARGIYRVRGAPADEHLDLQAAWLQLAPGTSAWERGPEDGVVSHRSAAALHRLGHLPADVHEFTFARRRQSRRSDVRIHRGDHRGSDLLRIGGMPVSAPPRIVADLLADHEDPTAVGHVVADALRGGLGDPRALAVATAPLAGRLGLPESATSVLGWLLELTGERDVTAWIEQAS